MCIIAGHYNLLVIQRLLSCDNETMVKMIFRAILFTAFMLVYDFVSCSSTPPDTNNTDFGRSLPTIESCDASNKYRTFDGTCNNLVNPTLGSAFTPVVRLLPPSYADGKSKIRLARDGKPLPSPRLVRTTLLPDGDSQDPEFTLGVMSWGQMIAHDVALRALIPQPDEPETCCNKDGSVNPHAACLPIIIPPNDPFFSKYNQTCLEMKRVSVYNKTGVISSPVQQVSGVTHFMDGSFIYGLDKAKSDALRLFRGGLLKTQTTNDQRPFLINVDKASTTTVCDVPSDTDVCYLSGDPDRVNLNTEIAASQIMFLRLHNILATDLHRLNSFWSDETLFQEARRIVIAIVQHITYNEYLPVLLGSKFVKEHKLEPQQSGYAKGYDTSINPSSISEFVAAAFRTFHNSISGTPNMVSEGRQILNTIHLSDYSNRPGGILQASDNFDQFLRGLISQSQNKPDSYFTEEITDSFLKRKDRNPPEHNGTDLISIDINRGRDYGVPPYTVARSICKLPDVNDFDDLKNEINADKIELLKKVYSNVQDIDYFVGGLLEKKYPGSLTSPSFQCVIAKAFYRYKFGDRFFYEFGGHPGAFTLAQLESIRNFTYSTLVCLTSDDIKFAQPSGFKTINLSSNPIKACSEITEKFKLDAWIVA